MLITILWMSPLLTAYPAIVDSCADVNRQVCQRSVWEVSCWVEDRRKREEDTGRKLFVPYSLGKIKPLFSLQECPTPSLKNNVLIGCADDNRPPTQVTVVLVRGSINCASCCHQSRSGKVGNVLFVWFYYDCDSHNRPLSIISLDFVCV